MHALLHIESNESRAEKLLIPVLLVPRCGTVVNLDFKVIQFSEELIRKLAKTKLNALNILPPYAIRYRLINLLTGYGFSLISQSSFTYTRIGDRELEEQISHHEYVFTLPKNFHHETFPDVIEILSP
ncbi:MAG: hypothetical protein US70_C0015G0013 [Parcubacteria group bacterium GW2011_GWD2_38_11]|nr:MAG: hypothetical protein US70_C0015G0013 [Parcubacteria group bacterium GW2011_GWD2_38_11]